MASADHAWTAAHPGAPFAGEARPAWLPRVRLEALTQEALRARMASRPPDFELVGYLHRWQLPDALRTPGLCYLHAILRADEAVLHDHPFSFRTHVLSGGYDSVNWREAGGPVFTRSLRCGDVADLRAGAGVHEHHYVSRVLPNTLTLIVAESPIGEWGFTPTPDGAPPTPGRPLPAGSAWRRHREWRSSERPECIRRAGYQNEVSPPGRAALAPAADA